MERAPRVAQEGELRDDSHRGKADTAGRPSRRRHPYLTLQPSRETATATATALSGDSFPPAASHTPARQQPRQNG
jgi:hypothetical protein